MDINNLTIEAHIARKREKRAIKSHEEWGLMKWQDPRCFSLGECISGACAEIVYGLWKGQS